ncbi:hypothetical protein GCM10020331_093190 [Ectobacillus funiculus]
MFLVLIGTQAFMYSLPIALAIILLLLIVARRFTVFPSGGGAYIVAREHIGRNTSLTAGAALMIDYVLTVAVSISSGVAALLSAFSCFTSLSCGVSGGTCHCVIESYLFQVTFHS